MIKILHRVIFVFVSCGSARFASRLGVFTQQGHGNSVKETIVIIIDGGTNIMVDIFEKETRSLN